MKLNRLFVALVIVIASFLLMGNAYAQFNSGKNANASIKDNDRLVYDFEGTLDTVGQANVTLTSSAFNFNGYDGDNNLTLSYRLTVPYGTAKFDIILLRSDDGTNFNSIAGADTVVNNATTADAWQYVNINLTGQKAEQYKLKFVNVATSPDGLTFKAKLKSTKKNYPKAPGY